MGYDIGWVVLGDEPLRMDEIEDLQAHVTVWKTWIVGYDLNVSKAPQDRIQAYFSLRPDRRADAEKVHGYVTGGYAPDVVDDVFDAMTELRDIVRRHEVVVQDDFFTYRWNGHGWKDSKTNDAPSPKWTDPNWVSIGALDPAQVAEVFADRPFGERSAPTKKRRKPFTAADRLDADDLDGEADDRDADDLDVDHEPPRVDATPVTREPTIDRDQAIAELVDLVIAERSTLTDDECTRYGLTHPDPPATWALREMIAKLFADRWAEPVALYLLAGAERWADSYGLGDVANLVFERALSEAPIRGPAAAAWWRSLEQPEKANRTLAFFRSLAPVLVDEAVAILRAPLPALDSDIGNVALETVSAARSEDAMAILVACIRRDRHRPGWSRWRERALEALERVRDPRGVPTALLELEQSDATRSTVRLIATEPEQGISLLARLRDCAGLIEHSIEFLENARDTNAAADTREALLEHPFWKARLYALRLAPYSKREAEAPAVWTTLEGADAEPSGSDRENYVGSLGAFDRERFLAVSRERGFVRELSPLPTAVEGLAARCADHRTWALSYVDRRGRAEDAPALVLADELDLALAARGHVRTIVMWSRWRRLVADIPADTEGRGRWARERLDRVPAPLRAVAERGAEAVAADYPSGRFTLTPEEREHFARIEHDIAMRGSELLARP